MIRAFERKGEATCNILGLGERIEIKIPKQYAIPTRPILIPVALHRRLKKLAAERGMWMQSMIGRHLETLFAATK